MMIYARRFVRDWPGKYSWRKMKWKGKRWTHKTLSFNRVGDDMGVKMKTDLDPTTRYLVLADID